MYRFETYMLVGPKIRVYVFLKREIINPYTHDLTIDAFIIKYLEIKKSKYYELANECNAHKNEKSVSFPTLKDAKNFIQLLEPYLLMKKLTE